MAGIGRLSGVALECRDPVALAEFYSRVLGWPIVYRSDDWCSIGEDESAGFHISFQLASEHEPPTWPDPASSMQFHLHVRVVDLEVAHRAVLEWGGKLLDHQPHPETSRVFADPAGHPFCLVGG